MRIAKKGDLMQAEREMRQNDAQERDVATSKAARSQKMVDARQMWRPSRW